MANQTTKEKINMLSEAEWEELSLRETLSAEEALCDAAEPQFMVETADLPKSDKDLVGFAAGQPGEFDQYQFFNQDQLTGLSQEDAEDLADPDRRGGGSNAGDQAMNEEIHTLGKTNKEFADIQDPNKDVAENDMPPVDEFGAIGNAVHSTAGTKDSVTEKPVNESYFDRLLAEDGNEDSVDNSHTDDNNTVEGDDDDDEDMADFDEDSFISDLEQI